MSFRAQGMRAWLLQRLTAIYIAIFLLSLFSWMIATSPLNYVHWHGLFSQSFMLVATIIFYLSLFIHAWVGIRDILVDYINHSVIRFILLIGLALSLSGMTLWLLLIVIGLVK